MFQIELMNSAKNSSLSVLGFHAMPVFCKSCFSPTRLFKQRSTLSGFLDKREIGMNTRFSNKIHVFALFIIDWLFEVSLCFKGIQGGC